MLASVPSGGGWCSALQGVIISSFLLTSTPPLGPLILLYDSNYSKIAVKVWLENIHLLSSPPANPDAFCTWPCGCPGGSSTLTGPQVMGHHLHLQLLLSSSRAEWHCHPPGCLNWNLVSPCPHLSPLLTLPLKSFAKSGWSLSPTACCLSRMSTSAPFYH